MRGQRLSRRPFFQIFLGHTLLRMSYALPRRTEIVLEGAENVPANAPVFFAMNHTDRYNYWPFQYGMWRRGMRFTATWVKGKYFEHPLMARFMIATNNIPLPSRGYVIVTEFRRRMKRVPTPEEYRALRDLSDGIPDAGMAVGGELAALLAGGTFLREFETLFAAMNAEVVRLNRQALFEKELNVLVFPQGTRSIRLSTGHIGLAQMSQHFGVPIVPVGCNGSDHLYPGGSPWSKGGRVVYRIGKPLALDGPEIGRFRVATPFVPFSRDAQSAHVSSFRAITDVVMDAINELLDPPYRYAADKSSDGVRDVSRFV
ncbi:MAG TPA: lysophospholipid acyltransferase family protein [bacterium]|nr:lysophospholipid acyltransferase family protein [bacterium]